MSNPLPSRTATRCPATPAAAPELQSYPARESSIGGGFTVRRALPHRRQRLVGPWCFLDHFGPTGVRADNGLDVAPHPHIGLQTVTWLTEGGVLHRDSLGYEQLIRPGQLNLMTAGHGIAHSEETPPEHSARLHGAQLWVALPDANRHTEPGFEHHAELPVATLGACRATVLMGELGDARSPATTYSPMVAAEIAAPAAGGTEIPLEPGFEHALVVIEGSIDLDGRRLAPGALHYLGVGRDHLGGHLAAGTRLMLVGGAPFGEEVILWWNFVARTPEEIAAAREDWEARRGFGEVTAYGGGRIPAPPFDQRPKASR